MKLTILPTYALAAEGSGTIQGRVVNVETQSPIEVTVTLYVRNNMDFVLASATSNASTGDYTKKPGRKTKNYLERYFPKSSKENTKVELWSKH